jgi:general secretion pathway protein G
VRPKEYILLAATIAMLSMLIIPKIVSYERAHNDRPRIGGGPDIQAGVKSLIDSYKVDNGFYPKSFQDLLQEPSGATNWHGPYLEKIPVDPWGHKYIYENPGKHNPSSYDLSSAGPDGTAGTDDDIGNWMN